MRTSIFSPKNISSKQVLTFTLQVLADLRGRLRRGEAGGGVRLAAETALKRGRGAHRLQARRRGQGEVRPDTRRAHRQGQADGEEECAQGTSFRFLASFRTAYFRFASLRSTSLRFMSLELLHLDSYSENYLNLIT